MADQRDRYQVVSRRPEWLLRGPVGGVKLREFREEAGLLDEEWQRLQREIDAFRRESEDLLRRIRILAGWNLFGFCLVIVLGLLQMVAANDMLPR